MNPGWRGSYLRYQSYFLNVIARYKERADVKAYTEILLSLATISVFAIFALKPTLLTIAGLMKEIEAKRQTLEEMQHKIDNLTSAQRLYDRESSKINILLTSIPDKPNPEIFARQIEGLSGKYGSQITGITVGEAVIIGKDTKITDKKSKKLESLPGGSEELAVSATFIADLDRHFILSNIISDLEKSRRPAKIDTIRMKTTTTEQKIKVLELFIEARLPYYKDINN